MSAVSVNPSFPIFTDIDGQPLEDGNIFIGTAGLNPIANPISAYWDAALTQVATQPVRTRGGYPINNGVLGMLYVNSDYSLTVQNKNGSTVSSSLVATSKYGNLISFSDITGTLGSDRVTFLQAGTGATSRTAQAKLRDVVSVKDFGAVGDGVADDTAAFQNAIAYVGANTLRPLALFVPTGQYRITTPLTAGAYVYIIGETRRSIISFDHANTGLTLTGGIGRLEKLHFTRGNSFIDQGINLYFNAAPEWVLEAVRSSFANVGLQTKDSHLLSFKDCVIDQNVTGYLDDGRSFAQTWVDPQFYNNDYGCDLKSEHTFLGGAIELSTYNDVLLNTTADYQSQFRGVAQFLGVHFEAKDGLPASTDPNILVGPNSSGTNFIRLTLSGCLFAGNSSNRPAISLRRATIVNLTGLGISGYGSPSASIITTNDTGRLITSSITSTVTPVYSINPVTNWTNIDGALNSNKALVIDSTAVRAADLNTVNDTGGAQDVVVVRRKSPTPAAFKGANIAVEVPDANGASANIGRITFDPTAITAGAVSSYMQVKVRNAGAEVNPVIVTPDNLWVVGGAWDSTHLRLGNYRLWVDSTGDLRIKNGAPASDTDGTVVGTQT